jgi:hypothetical protein
MAMEEVSMAALSEGIKTVVTGFDYSSSFD